jgi:transcriptional regulator with XRE-family HTH domain
MDHSNKIYELRKKEDISQEALMALIGTTRQQISRRECGISVPTPKFAYALTKHFNVTIEELFGEEISAKEKDDDYQTSFTFKSKVIIFTVLAFTNYLLIVLQGK